MRLIELLVSAIRLQPNKVILMTFVYSLQKDRFYRRKYAYTLPYTNGIAYIRFIGKPFCCRFSVYVCACF